VSVESMEDFGCDFADFDSEKLVGWLQNRVQEILVDVKKSAVWDAVINDDVPVQQVVGVLREIYLEIVMYQPDAIEGAIAAIAQFPRTMQVAIVDEMLHHQVEEFDHGEMALRDYIAMGGNEEVARTRKQSPSAFAVAAIWRNIAHKRDPYCYLGAVYLFDALTPIITDEVQLYLSKRLGDEKGLEFIVHHATADKEHEESIRQLIGDIAKEYPDKIESIAYGFEYFAAIYPLPCWSAAHERAKRIASA